jgi:hypothetical protein
MSVQPSPVPFNKKGRLFLFLTLLFFTCCFAFAHLGSYMGWLFSGATLYCAFLSVYNFVLASKAKYPFRRKRRETAQEKELRDYIRNQIPILVSVLLGGLMIAVAMWLFFS